MAGLLDSDHLTILVVIRAQCSNSFSSATGWLGHDYIAKGTFLLRQEDFIWNEHFVILLPVLNSF